MINASSITANSAASGGDMMNLGQLTVTSSTFSSNTAVVSAISHEGGSLALLNTTLAQNIVQGSGSAAALRIWAGATAQNTIVGAIRARTASYSAR